MKFAAILFSLAIASVYATNTATPPNSNNPSPPNSRAPSPPSSVSSKGSVGKAASSAGVVRTAPLAERLNVLANSRGAKIGGAVALGAAAVSGITAAAVLGHQKNKLATENDQLRHALATPPPETDPAEEYFPDDDALNAETTLDEIPSEITDEIPQ